MTRFRLGAEFASRQCANRLDNLLRLVFANVLELHSEGGSCTIDVGDKPEATRLARYQASYGNSVTNQRHHTLGLSLGERVLDQYLNGASTRDDIGEMMVQNLKSGKLKLRAADADISDEKQMIASVRSFCDKTLVKFADNALLVGGST